ncbi:MAG TPA: MMPL family transporter [Myxococcales bacterium]|nr:MMPL family transporter [Myxococcales bacterium]
MSDRLKIAAGLLLLLAMGLFCARRLRVSTEITFFLPDTEDQKLAEISRQLMDSPLTRSMILSVEAPDQGTAIAAGKGLAAALRGDPEIAWVRGGPGPGVAEEFYRLFFPHRFQMLSGDPERELPARFSDAGLSQAARRLKGQLAQPLGALVKRIAGDDPLLAFLEQIKRLEAARAGPLEVRDDQFITADGRCAIVFLAARRSPFDAASQGPLLARIRTAFASVNAAFGGTLRLEQSGVNRFAVDAERVVRNDIDRISLVSISGIVVAFLLLFRSLRVLLVSFIPLLFGVLTATTAGLLVYGSLHGLTLAFGSTLLGVCIDYPILYLNHQALEPHPAGPWSTLRRIRGALLLGALTTLGGFAGLAWTTFPGMRQMALFATAGIAGALAATWWLLPPLVPRTPAVVPLHRALADGLGRLLEAMRRKRALLAVLPAAAAVVCAAGLPRLRWADDLSAIQRPNPALLAEDERVRARVSRMDSGRFIIATGPTEATALSRNDLVHGRLIAARSEGLVADFRSLHDLVFSEELQRRNLMALAAAPQLFERTAAALEAEGFQPEAFGGFERALAGVPPPPLALSEVLSSPLGDLASPFRVQMAGQVGILTLVRGVRDPTALERALAGLEGVRLFDQGSFLAAAYGRYRTRVQQMIGAGMVFVFAMLFAAYRSAKLTLATGVPAVLAAATTLALLALLGVETNLLHVVALLLVLGIGEDYAIFLVGGAVDPAELKASAMSVVLCCLSGVLSFGLLGFSEIPALRTIGVTCGLGILLSLVLAPTALVLVGREKPR